MKTIMRLILTIASHFKPESVQQYTSGQGDYNPAGVTHQQVLVGAGAGMSVSGGGFVTSGNFYDVPIPGNGNTEEDCFLNDTSKFTAPEYQVRCI